MLDVILYHDGLRACLNDYVDTIEANKMMLAKYKDVRFIMYTLPTTEQNYALASYLRNNNYKFTLVMTPAVVLNEEILFDVGVTLEARGLWNLITVIEAKRVLFLRVRTTLDSFEPDFCIYNDVDNFDLTGTIVNGGKFRVMMDDLRYPGYLTSDMVYLMLSSFPNECEEMKYATRKQVKPHQPASIVDFYNYIEQEIYPYKKHVDRRTLVKDVIRAEHAMEQDRRF